jgi:hypothetical protein
MGFAPTAFVWHHRRPSLRGYLKQQIGYGKAEALLIAKHPQRFTAQGDARWEGFVYSGGPVRAVEGSILYHGAMGQAGYQSVSDRMQPLRPLDCRFDTPLSRGLLALLQWLQPRLRSWYRCGKWQGPSKPDQSIGESSPDAQFPIWSGEGMTRDHYLRQLLETGWKPGGTSDLWDVEKDGTRLLLATERGDGVGAMTLVRVWGDRRIAEELLRRA